MTESPLSIPLTLLDRYMASECVPAEAEAVEAWLDSDPLHREFLWGMRTLRLVRGGIPPEQVDVAWTAFLEARLESPLEMGVNDSDILVSLPARAEISVQAGTVLATDAGQGGRRPASERLVSGLRPAGRPPRIVPRVMATHSPSWRGWATALVAASVLAALGLGVQQWRKTTAPRLATGTVTATEPVRTYTTTRGQRVTVQLPDGSRVTLGPESRVEVPAAFPRAGNRNVYLAGAAYFEVTHDPNAPFTVHAGDAVVQATGTAFSVVRYDTDSDVRVVVSQGRVSLRNDAMRATGFIVLSQYDAATLSPTGRSTKRHGIDAEDALAWTRGELVFRSMPLSEVATMLERWYDVAITIPDSAVAAQRVTASFGREGVADVIRQLADAVGIQYRYDGRTIVLEQGRRP